MKSQRLTSNWNDNVAIRKTIFFRKCQRRLHLVTTRISSFLLLRHLSFFYTIFFFQLKISSFLFFFFFFFLSRCDSFRGTEANMPVKQVRLTFKLTKIHFFSLLLCFSFLSFFLDFFFVVRCVHGSVGVKFSTNVYPRDFFFVILFVCSFRVHPFASIARRMCSSQWMTCKRITITIYIYIYIYEGCSKTYKPQPEEKSIAEHFCNSNTRLILIKLEKNLFQIPVLISKLI